MKILAFGASNNKKSINRQLATFAAGLHPTAEVEVIDINDFEMPIFSDEREAQLGQPELAKLFFSKIGAADAIIISFAEHNGNYTAAYKNLFDWTSRINKEVFQNKPAVFLSTSPGPGGANSVLGVASQSAQYFGADLKASISVPSFYDNFDGETNQLTNLEIKNKLLEAVNLLG